MSVDVARLVFEIDSTQADPAEKKLDRLIAAGERADATFRKLRTATELAGIGMKNSADATQKVAKTATELAATGGAMEKVARSAAKASDDVAAAAVREAGAWAKVEGALAKRNAAFRGDAALASIRESTKAADDEAKAWAKIDAALDKRNAAFRGDMAAATAVANAKAASDAAREQAKATREAAMLDRQVNSLRASLDATAAVEVKLADRTRVLNAALEKGRITQAQYTEWMGKANAAAEAGTALIGKYGAATGLAGHQLTNLSFQLNDVVTGLLSGQRPLQILAQQGGQVFQILQQGSGGVSGALKGILGWFTPVRLAIGGIATVALLATAAAIKFGDSMARLGELAAGAGRQSGLAASQINEIAKANAPGSGAGVGQARELEAQLLQTGKVGGQVFGDLIQIQNKYAIATGQDLKTAQKELAAGFADPIKGAETLADRLSGVDGRTQELITSLVAQGRSFEAQVVLARAYKDSLQGVESTSQTLGGQLSILGNKIGDVSNWFAEATASAQAFILLGPKAVAEMKRLQAEQAKQKQGEAAANNASRAGSDLFFRLNPDAARQRDIGAAVSTAARGLAADSQKGSIQGVLQNADALERATRAQRSYIPVAQKAHELAVLDAQANQVKAQKETAATRAKLGSIAAQRTEIELSGEYLTRAEVEQRKRDAAAVAASHQEKASTGHAEALAREAAAMEASVKGAYDLAAAYLKSDGAALEAEARRKATTDATRKGADVEAQVRRQLALSIADVAVNYAKSAAGLESQITAQRGANDAVADGTMTVEQANAAMEQELYLRPLVAAAAKAEGKDKQFLLGLLKQLDGAYVALNKDRATSAAQASSEDSAKQIEQAKLELTLLGKSNAERSAAIARLQTLQNLRGQPGFDPKNPAVVKAGEDAAAAAESAANLATTQNNYNDSLRATLDLLEEIAGHTQAVARGLGEGLGRAGEAIGGLVSGLADYKALQERFNDEEDAAKKAARVSNKATAEEKAISAKRIGEIEALYAKKRENAEVEANLASLNSFKHLFSQKSTAYKALTALETAYRAIQLAGMIREAAADAIHTVKTIGLATARAAAHGVEAIARAMASLPFPFNLAAGAATAAALVAFGVKVFGHGGGGGSVPTAEERQKTQGTGTVLGSADAKSESIAHSLDIVAANSNRDLEYSNSMLRALRSIDQNIGSLTAALARQLGAGGAFDTSGLNLGSSTKISGVLGLPSTLTLFKDIPVIGGVVKSLFGTKTTTTLRDQGLAFDPQSLDQIVGGGLDGSAYNTVDVKTRKRAFGITYSNKTKTKTTDTALDDDVLAEMTRVIDSLRSGVLAAAGALGVEGADAVLKAFQVNLGQISFKDMDAQQIQDTLNAVFGKLGDQMAAAIMPGLSEFQKAGEGAFETLVRVAREVQVVDVSLTSIGMTLDATGISGIRARDSLVKLFGSLDDFTEQTQFFAENFLSEAERIAPVQAAVQKEFARLGVTGVNTKEQFKELVLGLDLTTAAGQQMYAALLAVAPAFAKVFDYLNPDAANAAADGWRGVFQSMQDWIRTLNGEITSSVQSTAQAYTALQTAAVAARGGDLTAAGRVVDLGKAYLDAAKASAGSEFEYLQAVARARAIASSVQLTAASNAGMATGAASTTPFSPITSATGSTAPSYTYTPLTSGTGFATGGSFMIGGTGSGDSQDFGNWQGSPGEIVNISRKDNMEALVAEMSAQKAEVTSLRADLRAAMTALARNTGRTAKVLENWDGAGLPPDRDAEQAA